MKDRKIGLVATGMVALLLVNWAPWLSALVLNGALGQGLKNPVVESANGIEQIEVRGRVVCLPEAMHRLYATELPPEHEHVFGFESKDGTFYTLLGTKYSEALFVDARVREKELLLKGRLFPKSHIFEVTRTRSVRHGEVSDLYYYCSVCSIESVSPGICACCQGPVELVEKPLHLTVPR